MICTAVGTGILCYLLIMMCWYDMEAEKSCSRGKYFISINRRRVTAFILCLALCGGLTWLFDQYHYGPLKAVRYLLLLAFLVPVGVKDGREKTIPNRWLIYILICRGALFLGELLSFPDLRAENIRFVLYGGLLSGIIFFVAYVISRHAVGMGDVKLFAVIGMCLGFRVTYLVMLASLILSALYGGCMVLRKKKNLKDEIPFGPFIAAGTWIVLLIGA